MLAVNHLGPFLMTNLLLDRLDGARVVTTSSGAHAFARIELDDLDAARRFSAMRQYGVTKLANILFTRELARRAPRLDRDLLPPRRRRLRVRPGRSGADAIRDAARETLPAHAGARRRHRASGSRRRRKPRRCRDGTSSTGTSGRRAVRARTTRSPPRSGGPASGWSGSRREPGHAGSRTGPTLFRSSSSALPRTSRSGSVPTCA